MIQRITRHTKSKNKGFLLAEAIFAVFITLLIVLILQVLIKTIMLSDRAEHRTDDIVFAYVQFNHFLTNEDVKAAYIYPKASTSRQAAIEKVTADGQSNIYLITHYKNMIRVTTPEGGHMPLLLNVKKAFFVTQNSQIKIMLTENDGRQSEIYFKLNEKPKKKVKNEKNKTKKT